MARNILLLNGPNLNLLGSREPEIYGSATLSDVETEAKRIAAASGVALSCFQSNHEGALIDRIHAAKAEGIEAIVINPGGLTHTSVALRCTRWRWIAGGGGSHLEHPPARSLPP